MDFPFQTEWNDFIPFQLEWNGHSIPDGMAIPIRPDWSATLLIILRNMRPGTISKSTVSVKQSNRRRRRSGRYNDRSHYVCIPGWLDAYSCLCWCLCKSMEAVGEI